MDNDIQETVESLLGKDIKIVDCEKKSNVQEEEILLVNGFPVTLDCENGQAIKNSLLQGNVPDCELLNDILIKAGILKSPVKLETSLSVKTSTTTKEEVTVSKGGQIVDGRSRETKENNLYTSETSEIWEPVGVFPSNTFNKHPVITTPSSTDDLDTSFSSCSSSESNSLHHPYQQQQGSLNDSNSLSSVRRSLKPDFQYSMDNSSSPSIFSVSTTTNSAPYLKHSNNSMANYPRMKPLKYKETTITSITETPSVSLSSLSSSLPSNSSSV